MKYYVISMHWDDERKCDCEYIAGEFSDYANASLFRSAYVSRYLDDAVIVDDLQLLNAKEV